MADPIAFTSISPRFGLPLLFAGQSQKEFYVNQAHLLADAMLHPVVAGIANSPPATPTEGQSWIVGTAPTGIWIGHGNAIATFAGGSWNFAAPQSGMRVFDSAAKQDIRYRNGWIRAAAVALPTGGTTIDTDARTAIAQLIAALVQAGVLPET